MVQVKRTMKRVVMLVLAVAVLMCSGAITDVMVGNVVVVEAATMKLSKKSAELVPYETLKLQVKNAGKKKITWKSSNAKVATVSTSGKVTAKNAAGKSCTITATVGKKSLKCKIDVVESKYYGTYKVYDTNEWISGIAADGETYVENAWIEYIDVIMKKDGYYYTVCEAHNYDVSDYYVTDDNNGKGYYIGKKLPKCFTDPTKYEGYNAVNLFADVNNNDVFEPWRDYSDEEWADKLKELGYTD